MSESFPIFASLIYEG